VASTYGRATGPLSRDPGRNCGDYGFDSPRRSGTKTHDPNQETPLAEANRRPCKGDRVRLRDCAFTTSGIVVDEFSTDYVSVQWDDLPAPATYRRSSLELEEHRTTALTCE
jgi:hypothetical protein